VRIREKARELGFDEAGVARLGKEPPGVRNYVRWTAGKMHGGMKYMERAHERLKPWKILPDVRSVVCVLKNYYAESPAADDPMRGAVARYAQGDDYHDVLGPRMQALCAYIEQSARAPAKWYVDTGPILEKPWAREAGLGWPGKHTVLISRRYSSWFFLGVVFVAADLDPDPPHEKDHCGTCTRCIEACPTGAIVKPYVLDARKCISYLTVEHGGAIPWERRAGMGNRIFGCDACLDACPWNRFARPASDGALQPRGDLQAPRLDELMKMSDADFQRRFRRSPIRRAGRDAFLRNVAVALGNSGSPEAVGPLVRGLGDEDVLVRMHAAWGLGRLETGEAMRALEARRETETVKEVRKEIERALAFSGG
jgi:epoxyqueuosine reductase